MASSFREVGAKEVLDKLKRLPRGIKTALEDAWPDIVEQCLDDIQDRAPTHGQEYRQIMGHEAFGPAPGGVSLSGNRSSDPDRRVRFIRGPGIWLKELVRMPGSYSSNSRNLTIRLGIESFLNENSRFSWINIHGRKVRFTSRKQDKPKVISPGVPIKHTSDYGVFYWFENGAENIVIPRGNYKLNPDGNPDHRVWEMPKSYRRYRMYKGFRKKVFTDAVRQVIRDVRENF